MHIHRNDPQFTQYSVEDAAGNPISGLIWVSDFPRLGADPNDAKRLTKCGVYATDTGNGTVIHHGQVRITRHNLIRGGA